jgi:hypothetical protein
MTPPFTCARCHRVIGSLGGALATPQGGTVNDKTSKLAA